MKTDEELITYRRRIHTEYGRFPILRVTKDCSARNSEGTSNRKAPCGLSWIDYWRALTGNHDNQLTCSSCGKIIYVDEVPKMMSNIFAASKESDEDHRAFGGHVEVRAPANANYRGGDYIVPLCPECNNQLGEVINIVTGTMLCKDCTEPFNGNQNGEST